MKLFTAAQMRQADEAAVQAGIPSQVLMEAAGQAVTHTLLSEFSEPQTFLILCGKGNNGGDGYVAARYLLQAGKAVSVLELASKQTELRSNDAQVARASFLSLGQTQLLSVELLLESLKDTDVIVDALFGSGLTRALEGDLLEIVTTVNAAQLPVVSVDVPSGVHADNAALIDEAIQASRTVQLAGPKLASAFYPARAAFGVWSVADIGMPASILEAQSDVVFLEDVFVRSCLPKRAATAHKYSAGTVLVVAGSARYLGAAELACRAAFRAGAGLVTLAAEARLPNSWPELIFEAIQWQADPLQNITAIPERRAQARVIGPGLDEQAQAFLPKLILQSPNPTVLDAGALIANDDWFQAVKEHTRCVLTPHAGEAAKLLIKSTAEINENPIESARALALKTNAVVVLKGATTVIADANKRVFVSTRGHAGMATGGTGDVLAGLIGAFLAHAEDLTLRTCAAVYLHGLAGERAAEHYGNGLIASDLSEQIAKVWLELSKP